MKYEYRGDKAVGTYHQDPTAIYTENKRLRDEEDVRTRIKDLDMGFKFASVSKVEWLKIKEMGIDQDPVAIMKYMEINQHLKTTKRRLV